MNDSQIGKGDSLWNQKNREESLYENMNLNDLPKRRPQQLDKCKANKIFKIEKPNQEDKEYVCRFCGIKF